MAPGVGSGRFGVGRARTDIRTAIRQARWATAAGVAPTRARPPLQDTIAAWRSWSEIHQRYQGPWPELVHISGRVLRALTFYPTGAVSRRRPRPCRNPLGAAATGTTATPGSATPAYHGRPLGGRLPDEAEKFFRYLATAAATSLVRGADLQIMFGVAWRPRPERAGAPPPRRLAGQLARAGGNGAWTQRQLDIYGDSGGARRLRDQISELDQVRGTFWSRSPTPPPPLAGEGPGHLGDPRARAGLPPLQGHVLGRAGPRRRARRRCSAPTTEVEGWNQTREQIHATVLREGWSDRPARSRSPSAPDDLDASALMMPLVGFLPATDPRMLATIEAIAERLTDDRPGLPLPRAIRWSGQGRAHSCSAHSGWPRRWRWPGRPNEPGRSSKGHPYVNDSVCLPRRLTRPPANCWATSRRPSAISAWSMPPGPSPKPSRGRKSGLPPDSPRRPPLRSGGPVRQRWWTGRSAGMGRAMARPLVSGGARVLVTGRAQASLDDARVQLGERATVVRGDAGSLDARLFAGRNSQRLVRDAGRCCAQRWHRVSDSRSRSWRRICHREARLSLITSVADVQGSPMPSAYAALRLAGRLRPALAPERDHPPGRPRAFKGCGGRPSPRHFPGARPGLARPVGDQPGAAAVGYEACRPPDQHDEAVLPAHQEGEVDEQPRHPREEPAQPGPAYLRDCLRPANGGQGSLVAVGEARGGEPGQAQPRASAAWRPSCIAAGATPGIERVAPVPSETRPCPRWRRPRESQAGSDQAEQ